MRSLTWVCVTSTCRLLQNACGAQFSRPTSNGCQSYCWCMNSSTDPRQAQQRVLRTALVFFALTLCPVVMSPPAHVDAASTPRVASTNLIIKDGVFSRASVVVPKGGTLTLKNVDSVAYRIKIGATLVIVPARGSKTVPLPQRGVFSITCAKVPSLKATLTVK